MSVPNPSSLCFVKMVLFTHTKDITGDIRVYKLTTNNQMCHPNGLLVKNLFVCIPFFSWKL